MDSLKSDIKRTKLKISNGSATKLEVRNLITNLEKVYKKEGKELCRYIELSAFKELKRRMDSSVFSEIGEQYPKGYRNYCMYAELKNTNLLISFMKKLIGNSKKASNFLTGEFFGFRNSNYTLTWEFVIHFIFRHNKTIQNLKNPDSEQNGYKQTTMENYMIPLLLLFMILNALNESDWIDTQEKKNCQIVTVKVSTTCYNIIKEKQTNRIITFYPLEKIEEQKIIYLEHEINRSSRLKRIQLQI